MPVYAKCRTESSKNLLKKANLPKKSTTILANMQTHHEQSTLKILHTSYTHPSNIAQGTEWAPLPTWTSLVDM